nr:hypothetical protein Hi04_10k_c2441B_00019 [uncultured bacterium]
MTFLPSRYVAYFAPLVALAAAACHGSAASGPTIDLDTSRCEAQLQTLATFGGAPSQYATAHAIAAGADGTVYFDRREAGDGTGIYAIAHGQGDPVRISTFAFVDQLWVDGATLLVASTGRLLSMPTSGGEPTLVSQIPPGPADPPPLVSSYVLAADGVYVGVGRGYAGNGGGSAEFDVYVLPRAGGDARLVAKTQDSAFQYSWDATLQVDDANVYVIAGSGGGPVMSVPRAGGEFGTYVPHVEAGSPDNLTVVAGGVYTRGIAGDVQHYFLDAQAKTSSVAPLDGKESSATFLVGDGHAVYAGLLFGGTAALRGGIAQIPVADETTPVLGCTAAASDPTQQYVVNAMALDASYVYGLGSNLSEQWAVWRVARNPQ